MSGEKDKVKRDKYQKILTAYSQAIKEFRKGAYEKAKESLSAFLKKYPSEKELIDRARIYLEICEERQKKETIPLKTFDDYYQYSIYKINQGEYEEALKMLKKTGEMKPDEGKIFFLMADTYCLMGKEDECLEYLKKAIQLDKYFGILAQNEADFESLKESKKFNLITKMS